MWEPNAKQAGPATGVGPQLQRDPPGHPATPRTISLNGLTLAAEEPPAPSRPPVVLIHGYFGGAWYFERYQRFLAERGHPTYAVNLRGHHGSRPVPDLGRACARDYVADALEVACWLGRPIVLGHSMGGLFALKLAESDAVCAAVLLCPAPPRGIPIFSFRLAWRQLRYLAPLILSRPLAPRPADLDALMFNRIPAAERPALYPQSGRIPAAWGGSYRCSASRLLGTECGARCSWSPARTIASSYHASPGGSPGSTARRTGSIRGTGISPNMNRGGRDLFVTSRSGCTGLPPRRPGGTAERKLQALVRR